MGIHIALAGNPNSGKTTMFNDLTGAKQYVGNWPGVTVEKKEGPLRGDESVTVVDLPGIYSLSPYSPEEVVSRDYLLQGGPAAILNLVDGTNLERNLYLTTQLMEVGLPLVVALNMADLVRKNGDEIDVAKLEGMLGCRVVETSALKGRGTREAAQLAAQLAGGAGVLPVPVRFGEPVERALARLDALVPGEVPPERRRWHAVKLFERDEVALAALGLADEAGRRALEDIIAPVEAALDDDSEGIITAGRYECIERMMRACVRRNERGMTASDKIDRIVTNRWLALPIFAAVMMLVYYVSVSTIGTLVTDWTNDVLFGEWIGPGVESWLLGVGAAGWLVSLVVDGVIGGVGAILGFLPQMVVLFAFLSFLEDCGYMARVAFIMDRVFRKFGLSGRSFIPMLVSSGCGVPGIMATKTIENENDRRMTIITTTFIPCGAKLPIIALLAGTILGFERAWWIGPAMYFVGVLAVIVSGIMLKKTRLFAGETTPFVMELPQYHLPAPKSLGLHVWERAKSFVIKAGTVIFASSIVIWFLLAFGVEGGGFGMVELVENSLLAALGRGVAVVLSPLGFGNWQAAVGTLSGFVAKENLVSTLGVISGMSADAAGGLAEGTAPLWAFMHGILPGTAAALSFLAFNILCAPCFAAIGAIRRQMASAKWTAFAIGYQMVFAYAVALMVYQFGSLLAGGVFGAGSVAALCVLALMLFQLLRPRPGRAQKAAARC